VQRRGAAGAAQVDEGGVAVLVADAAHLARDLAQRLVPGDALELPGAARPGAAHRVLQAVLVVQPLDLADAAGAGMQRRQVGLPARRVGRDADDAVVDHVGVDHAAAAAIVAAGAGDDGLALSAGGTRVLVDRIGHGSSVAPANARRCGAGRTIDARSESQSKRPSCVLMGRSLAREICAEVVPILTFFSRSGSYFSRMAQPRR
jgi:hypothetical protein